MEQNLMLPLMPLNELVGNAPAHYNTLQNLILPYTNAVVIFWWFVWILTAMYLMHYVYLHGVRSEAD